MPSSPELIAESSPAAERAERRPFHSRQQIAAYRPGQPLEFVEVECCDISTTGLSFYVSNKPEADKLVCRFRALTGTIDVMAEVVRTWPEETATGLKLRVACRFIRRLD